MSDDPVRLMHYDPRWRQEFEQTRSSIFLCCDGWVTKVEHIGGTSLSGMIARPTIDCVATVNDDESLELAKELICGINFGSVKTPAWADGAVTLVKPRHETTESSTATHRVFLVVDDGQQHRSSTLARSVAVRDFLRQHPDLAIEFEETKVAGWKNSEGSLRDYQSSKSTFIARIEDQISG